MKNFIQLSILIISNFAIAQVGINTTTPEALLDIRASNSATPSSTDGILVPKVTAFPVSNPGANQHGMMVFLSVINGANQVGFYYWDFPSLTWKTVGIPSVGGGSGWLLTGNAGTVEITNFLGTTDNKNVVFRRNNIRAGFIGETNTAFGFNTLSPAGTGINNTALGVNSLQINTTGSSNTAAGYNSLYSNDSGSNNVGIGFSSLHFNTTGTDNIGIGTGTLYNNISGGFNIAVGSSALSSNTIGSNNIAVGRNAQRLTNNTSDNVAIGNNALYNNLTGNQNVALGTSALGNLTAGNNNIGIGYLSQVPTATGSNQLSISNTIYGTDMGLSTAKIGISQSVPTAKLDVNGEIRIGSTSEFASTIGAGGLRWNGATIQFSNGTTWNNIGPGGTGWLLTGNAGTNATTNYIGTSDNVDVVFKRFNTRSGFLGANDTSFGYQALPVPTTNGNNTAIGTRAMFSNNNNVNTINNTATGNEALYSLTNGNQNSAFGAQALRALTVGNSNTAIGRDAMLNFGTGNGNTATGTSAMNALTTGNNNSAFGVNALNTLTSGSNNLAIGYNAQVPSATGSNQVRVGDINISLAEIQVAWSVTSDKRWKNTITNSNLGLNFINQLRPVSYFRNNDDTKKLEYGLIAQELQQTLKDFNVENSGIINADDAGKLSVRYNDLISILVKSIQDQEVQMKELKDEIKKLKNK